MIRIRKDSKYTHVVHTYIKVHAAILNCSLIVLVIFDENLDDDSSFFGNAYMSLSLSLSRAGQNLVKTLFIESESESESGGYEKVLRGLVADYM